MALSGSFSIMGIFKWLIIEILWCSCYVVSYRISSLHSIIGWLIGIFIGIHIVVLHGLGSFNPSINNSTTSSLGFFIVVLKDMFIAIIIRISLWFIYPSWDPDYSGNSDNSVFANPLKTPEHITPELYHMSSPHSSRPIALKLYGCFIILGILLYLLY